MAYQEKEGKENGARVFQYFLNLEEPWVAEVVNILMKHGYFIGGLVPRWFDTDGILMQKLLIPPEFSVPHLYSEKAKRLLTFISSDWQALQV